MHVSQKGNRTLEVNAVIAVDDGMTNNVEVDLKLLLTFTGEGIEVDLEGDVETVTWAQVAGLMGEEAGKMAVKPAGEAL